MLTPRADGLLESATAVRTPFMAPRLQGELRPDGALRVAVWGAGDLATVWLDPLEGPFRFAPNRVTTPAGGLFVAQSAPVALVRGARLRGIDPGEHAASGCVLVDEAGQDLRVAAGADRGEAERALLLPPGQIVAEAQAHVRACDRLPEGDPVLRSLVIHGVHAALASARRDAAGGFAGLAAGAAYSTPARTYFRDAYWTTPLLLQVDPDLVRAEIDLLATGIQPDGEAPSGVITAGHAAWEAARLADPERARAHTRPGEWWSDHFDSPPLFVLMVADHQRATGDLGPAERHAGRIAAIAQRYRRLAGADGLPLKPRHDRDWADNVFREGRVGYDLGLWFGALASGSGEARAAIDAALWRPEGWYADYITPDGFTERHLALDTLTLLRFGAASDGKALSALAACRRILETRHNAQQPWGDWGVMCVFPPYARPADLRDKSADPFRYHNGGDWPWLDGLYAAERLRRGLPGWRWPLVRWWERCLEKGWPGAVEHYGPEHGEGSLIQAWSSLPAAVALEHRAAMLAGDSD